MSYSKPPAGWALDTPSDWGVYFDREETEVETGPYSVKVINTAGPIPNTYIRGPYVPIDKDIPLNVAVRSKASAAGGASRFSFRDLDEDYVAGGVWNAADTIGTSWAWEGRIFDPQSDAKWGQFYFYAANTAQDHYIDRLVLERHPPEMHYRKNGDQAITTGTWTTLAAWYNQSAPRPLITPNRLSINTTTGVATIEYPGTYAITANAHFDTVSDGTTVAIRLRMIGSTTVYRTGTMFAMGASGPAVVNVATTTEWLEPGDTIEVEVYHDEGSDISVSGSSNETNFAITRFGPV